MTPPAGARLEAGPDPNAVTVKGSGTPMGTVFEGAVTRVERIAGAGVVTDPAGEDGGRVKDGQVVHLHVH